MVILLLTCFVTSAAAAALDGFRLLQIATKRCDQLRADIPSVSQVLVDGISSNEVAVLDEHKGLLLLMEQASRAEDWQMPGVSNLHAFSNLRIVPGGFIRGRALVSLKALAQLERGNARGALRIVQSMNVLGKRLLVDKLSMEFLFHAAARASELQVQQAVVDKLPVPLLHPSLRNALAELESFPPMDICWAGERIMQSNTVVMLYERLDEAEDVAAVQSNLVNRLQSQVTTAALAKLVTEKGFCNFDRWERETQQKLRDLGDQYVKAISETAPCELLELGEQMKSAYTGSGARIPSAKSVVEAIRLLTEEGEITGRQLGEFHARAGQVLTLNMTSVQYSNWAHIVQVWTKLLALERIAVLELAARVYEQKEKELPPSVEALVASELVPAEVTEDPFLPDTRLRMIEREGKIRFYSVGTDCEDGGGAEADISIR